MNRKLLHSVLAVMLAAMLLTGCADAGGDSSDNWPHKVSEITRAESSSRKTPSEAEIVSRPDESEPPEEPEITFSYATQYYLAQKNDSTVNAAAKVLLQGMNEHSSQISLRGCELPEDEFTSLFDMLRCCEPSLGWVEHYYEIDRDSQGNAVNAYFKYRLSKPDIADALQELDLTAEQIAAKTEGLSDYDKLLTIHDYIIKHCDYDKDEDDAWCAYGCLVRGKAVCEGYSKALCLLCDKVGIPCLPVSGSSEVDGQELHMWNKAQLDGCWYNFDVTWDDPTDANGNPASEGSSNYDFIHYEYFGVSDERIQIDHSFGESLMMKYPMAAYEDGTYFCHTGQYITSADQADDVFRRSCEAALEKGELIFQLGFSDESVYDEVYTYEFEDCHIFEVLDSLYIYDTPINTMRYEYIPDEEHLVMTFIMLPEEEYPPD